MHLLKLILITFYICCLSSVFGQQDTILEFNLNTKEFKVILPVSIDSTLSFGKTASHIGSRGNKVDLELVPPTKNLFQGSHFGNIIRASDYFNVIDYPVRTAVKLKYYRNGNLSGTCSGTLVGSNMVLTAAHCLYNNFDHRITYDSLLILPAFDNGAKHPSIHSSMVDKFYIFKSYYDNSSNDIALVKLRIPIGHTIGWVGIAFSNDTSFFNGKVFHKFSYPGIISPFDSSKVYNGDTLYYNYGLIESTFINETPKLFINSSEALGIPGQSGSSLMFTDNTEHHVFGVLLYSFNYRHIGISKEMFHQFQHILNKNTSAPEIPDKNLMLKLYPNPFSHQTTLEFHNPLNEDFTLKVFDTIGKLVFSQKNITNDLVTIERGYLQSGLYLFQLSSENRTGSGKFIID